MQQPALDLAIACIGIAIYVSNSAIACTGCAHDMRLCGQSSAQICWRACVPEAGLRPATQVCERRCFALVWGLTRTDLAHGSPRIFTRPQPDRSVLGAHEGKFASNAGSAARV
jgi:hypothetical protein